jgi:hypothetical protein
MKHAFSFLFTGISHSLPTALRKSSVLEYCGIYAYMHCLKTCKGSFPACFFTFMQTSVPLFTSYKY